MPVESKCRITFFVLVRLTAESMSGGPENITASLPNKGSKQLQKNVSRSLSQYLSCGLSLPKRNHANGFNRYRTGPGIGNEYYEVQGSRTNSQVSISALDGARERIDPLPSKLSYFKFKSRQSTQDLKNVESQEWSDDENATAIDQSVDSYIEFITSRTPERNLEKRGKRILKKLSSA